MRRFGGSRGEDWRRTARLGALALALVLVLGAFVPCAAQQQEEQDPGEPPVERSPLEIKEAAQLIGTLAVQDEVLAGLVMDAVRDYRRIAMERVAAQQELGELEAKLDRTVTRIRDLSATDLESASDKVMQARIRYRTLSEAAERKLRNIEQLVRQHEAIGRRLADLRADAPPVESVLTGEWEVVWRPSNQRGTFYLDQSGTLVTGQYRLGPRRAGSLRGTFVGSKIRLERVDAERGRDVELEGYLSPDGTKIEGTWQAYEMVQGGLPHGRWIARRVD
jgi:hypothetical protein